MRALTPIAAVLVAFCGCGFNSSGTVPGADEPIVVGEPPDDSGNGEVVDGSSGNETQAPDPDPEPPVDEPAGPVVFTASSDSSEDGVVDTGSLLDLRDADGAVQRIVAELNEDEEALEHRYFFGDIPPGNYVLQLDSSAILVDEDAHFHVEVAAGEGNYQDAFEIDTGELASRSVSLEVNDGQDLRVRVRLHGKYDVDADSLSSFQADYLAIIEDPL